MHDAIEIDDRGTPAAVLVTEPFIPTVRAVAAIRDLPDYAFVLLPHPLGSLSGQALQERAHEAVPQVMRILLGKAVQAEE